jgi:hypothetical protein
MSRFPIISFLGFPVFRTRNILSGALGATVRAGNRFPGCRSGHGTPPAQFLSDNSSGSSTRQSSQNPSHPPFVRTMQPRVSVPELSPCCACTPLISSRSNFRSQQALQEEASVGRYGTPSRTSRRRKGGEVSTVVSDPTWRAMHRAGASTFSCQSLLPSSSSFSSHTHS